VFVMCHSRLVARNIICRILLNEESNGVRNLARDPDNDNSFTGHLDKDNSKPFTPEIYIVSYFANSNRVGSKACFICARVVQHPC
jgi:hypothetical protein